MSQVGAMPARRGTQRRVVIAVLSAMLLIIVAGALLAWYESPAARPSSATPDQPSASGAGASTLTSTVRPVAQYVVVFDRPPADPRLDSDIFVKNVPADGSVSDAEVHLGKFTAVDLSSTNTGTVDTSPFLALGSTSGQGSVVELTNNGPSPIASFRAGGGAPVSLRLADGTTVNQQSDTKAAPGAADQRLIVTNNVGVTLATYEMPQAKPAGPGQLMSDGKPVKVAFSSNSTLSALVQTGDGHVLALVQNMANSAVVDIATGERADFENYGTIQTAALSRDGSLYVVAWNWSDSRSAYQLIKLDASTLTIAGQSPIDFRPVDGPADGQALLALPDGDVYLYLERIGFESFSKIEPSNVTLTPVKAPADLGLAAGIGVDGKIYFWGGPARNTASLFDPETQQFTTDIPALRAPEGSFIRALVVR